MSCPDVKKIELYINGGLSEDEKAKLDAHFAECVYCRSQLEDIRKNEMLLPQIKSLLTEPNGLTIEQAQSFLPKRYHLVMKVSHGGSGQVFKASESPIGRWVAIKFLPKEVGLNEDRWREARLMSDLKHPNIATIYLPEEKDGIRFFVMEWIDGRPLVDACAAMPLMKKLELFLKVLDAIAIAHEKNIIHRDIKPSNILLDSNLEPKILDFGISVERHRMAAVNSNVFVGSPPHSAPEQVPPVGNITLATDVFSLGILLYQLMTDELPFPQTTIHELFEAIKHATPKTPRSINHQIPEELERICLKALEKNPKKRYIDAKKFAESIRKYLEKDARPVSPELNDFKSSVVNSPYLSPPDPAVFDLPIKENDLLADRYRILGKIGKSVGIVYRAYDSTLQMELAIKVLVLNNENTEDSFEQLRQEFLSRSKINDFTHVIKSFDMHLSNYEGLKLAILPMEYANGGSFRKWLSEHQDIEARVSEGVDLFKQACYGVKAVHDAGLAHLDLKPENILLCNEDDKIVVKISDFGLSRNLEHISMNVSSVMKAGLGSPYYKSPEQIAAPRQKDIDSKADIYSMGIILFEILDGERPFDDSGIGVIRKHLEMKPPRLDGVSKELSSLVYQCLVKNPQERIGHISSVIDAIDGNISLIIKETQEVNNGENLDIIANENFQWYRLNETFKATIIERISTDSVFLDLNRNVIAQGVNGAELSMQGCVRFWDYHNLKLVAIIDFGALIANGMLDCLKTCLATPEITVSRDLHYLSTFIKEGNSKNALYELEKTFECNMQIEPILLLITGFREMEKARSYLSRMMKDEKVKYPRPLLDAAKIWKIFFNDETKARACIAKAETIRPRVQRTLNECGQVYEMLLKDSNQARRCLEEEERDTKNSFDLLYIGLSWKILFDDNSKLISCIKKAENLIWNMSDWIECGKFWKIFLQDESEYERCLNQAKSMGYDAKMSCSGAAIAWLNLGDVQESRGWLDRMEEKAKLSSSWIECARAWKNTFNEDYRIRRCLEKAGSMADEYFGFFEVAKAWIELAGEEGKARKFMEKAEEKASEFSFEWEGLEECAVIWKEVFGDTSAAKRCKAKAKEAREIDEL